MGDTEIIDMSDYTNTKKFMNLILNYKDDNKLLLIFDLNSEISGPIYNMLMHIIFDKMLGDTQEIQFKVICLIDDTSDFNWTHGSFYSRFLHFNLID